MQLTASWKFSFLPTDYGERLNSSAKATYTATLGKIELNITSKLTEEAAYGEGNKI